LNTKSTVVTGLKWAAGGKFISQIITWATTIVVIRLLSPTDYGLMAMTAAITAFFALVSELGLGASIVQARTISQHEAETIFGLIICLNLGIVAALYVTAPLAAQFFEEPGLVDVIRVASLQFLFTAIGAAPTALIQRAMNFRLLATINLFADVSSAFVVLALAYLGFGVWALVGGLLSNALLRAIALIAGSPERLLPKFALRGLGNKIAFGGRVTLSRVLWYAIAQADTMIVGKILGKEALGFYAVAMQLASLPMQRISSIVNQVAFPALARHQDNRAAFRSNVLTGVRISCFVMCPVLWGISSVAPEIVETLLGEKWLTAIFPLAVIPLVMPLRVVSGFLSTALQSVGAAQADLENIIVMGITLVPMLIIGSRWGINGIAMAWVCAVPLIFVFNTLKTLRFLDITPHQLLRAGLPSFLAALGMLAIVYGARTYLLNAFAMPNWATLVTLCLIGALSYVALSVAINRDGLNEARHLIR
jgi:teichuronic acid exporter